MLATEVHHDDAEALVVAGTGPVPTKPKLGVYGAGAYKDECWSLQAYQKRVYAIRESYKIFLRGTGIENPGFDDRVGNLLSSIARLVGKEAVHVPDALIPKQMAALVQAADPKNRKLVLSAAMIAKGICDTNRSKQESLLDHKDFRIEVDEKGVMRGVSSKVGVTKTDRLQLGSTQQLRCTEYCDGKGVKFDEKGLFYLSLLCPAHLLLYVQELTVEELGRGVSVEMLGDCPFWADYAWLETLPKYGRHTLVAASDESPLYKAKVRKCDEVISIDEELQRGRASLVVMPGFDGQERGYRAGGSVWFEHAEHGFLVHAWPNTAAFTMRMRVLAVLAQRQALAAGTEAPFGNAMKVDDFKGIISTRILRRTGATAIAQSGRADAVQLGMSITGHKSVSMFEKYVQKVNVYASHAPNVSSIVLHQSTSSQGCKALIAAEAAAATESEASMHSRVVVLQEDLARKGATIASLEAELEARKEELDALKMAMIETKRMLETQRISTLQIGMDGDEFSTGSGKDPCSRQNS